MSMGVARRRRRILFRDDHDTYRVSDIACPDPLAAHGQTSSRRLALSVDRWHWVLDNVIFSMSTN